MSWLGIALWGGVVGLDATSFPQAMVSRPFVAGTVAGLLVGRPLAGAVLGALLEVFALSQLPIGAARNPEPGTAAVATTAAYALGAPAEPEAAYVLLALAFGLLWERLGGASVHALRRVNEAVAFDPSRRAPAGPRTVEARHLAALTLDLTRASLVTVVGAWLGARALATFGPAWIAGPRLATLIVVAVAAAVLGAALSVFGGWRRHGLAFGLGLAGGGLALLLM
ncbi:MAG: PTS sugar transporter subunit IIC [Gemmatimonadota bacterium]